MTRHRRLLVSGLLLTVLAMTSIETSELSAAPSPQPGTASPVATTSTGPAIRTRCDRDGDGARRSDVAECGGTDCNDLNKKIHPLAAEGDKASCQDGLDNNCDGKIDCADAGCEGQRVPLPASLTLELHGMCCGAISSGNDGGVADISRDAKNCGGCGIRCSEGQSCVDGMCLGACDIARTRCFTDPQTVASIIPPIKRSPFGDFPGPIQRMLDAYLGDPSCPRPMREPTFDVTTFSKPITDILGKPTGETVRGVCVSIRF